MVTRRNALATIGAGSLVGVAGCLGSIWGSGGTLQHIDFGGNTQDAQMEIIDRWAEESDYDVEATAGGGTTEMISMIKQNPGEFDTVAFNDTGISQARQEGILEPIDLGEVPNYEENIRDPARELEFLFEDGEVIGLIRENGGTGYAYNTEHVDRELTSWQDIKDPEFEGELALLDRAIDRFANCAVAIDVDINEAAQDDDLFEEVVAEAEEQHQNTFSYWSDGATSIQYLQQENAMICEAWGGRVLALQEDGYDHIEYVMPEEGTMAWTDTLSIVEGTENREAVHDLLNFIYERENLIDLSDMMNYTVQINDPPEEMQALPDFAPIEDLTFSDWDVVLPKQDEWSERFQEVKQG